MKLKRKGRGREEGGWNEWAKEWATYVRNKRGRGERWYGKRRKRRLEMKERWLAKRGRRKE